MRRCGLLHLILVGVTSDCDRMNAKRLVLTPGDSLARRFERRKGGRKLSLYSFLAMAGCVLADYFQW